MAHTIELWIAALLTFMIFSFLYKDNPFYKFAEHLFVGVSAAYWMVIGIWSTLMPNLVARLWPSSVSGFINMPEDAQPEYHFIIPAIFGILMLTRLIDRISWLSRWAMAFVIGFAAGTNFTRYLQSDFVGQIYNSMLPIIVKADGGIAVGAAISSIVLMVGVICALIYFFFSKEHTGAFGAASRLGIWFLMVTFGAAFGYTVMARISLLTGRVQFLGEWLTSIF
ncbi:MAG: hypothetical protein AMJ46_05575 [Latescibacteria bacterium DG_63]|nr:MAG: hypothetical protein AMJ46_05575 [Latescibacteria bacterium DG_63]